MIGLLLLVLIGQVIIILSPNLLSLVILISVIVLTYFIKKIKILLFLIPIILLTFITVPRNQGIPSQTQNIELTVVNQEINYSIVNLYNNKYLVYDDFGPIGSSAIVNGYFKELSRIKYPNISEFADYLNNNGVFYELVVTEVIVNNIKKDYRVNVINYLIDDNLKTAPFLRLLVFSDKTESLDFYQILKDLSIVHLFVISGFHINLLFSVISNTIKKPKFDLLLLLLIIPYLFLLNFTFPSIKAFLIILVSILNRDFNESRLDRLTITMLVAVIMISFNPLAIKSYSFLLSMVASINIALIETIKIKNKLLKYLLSNSLIYLGLLPILLLINYEFNGLAIVFNSIFSFLVPPIYILSLIVTLLKPLQALFYPIVVGFENFINLFNDYKIMLIMGKPTYLFIFFYYFNYLLLLINLETRYYSRFLISILFQFSFLGHQYFKPYLYPGAMVSFLNVGHGDSILIVMPYAKETFLVDTGGNRFYEVSKSRTIPYLKALGLKHLDYVIITHDDFDHNGSLPYLVNNFKVKDVIDGQSFETLNNLTNLNYGATEADDNNRSAVLYFTIKNTSFLLTGDIDDKKEKEIIKKHNLKINVLKVSHHGSRYGTTKELLDAYQPEIAIISTSSTNPYNHPHPSVLQRLQQENIKIFRTDKDGTINITFNQFSVDYLLSRLIKYVIITQGEFDGLFSLWLSKTIS